MAQRRNALGRGLGALLPSPPVPTGTPPDAPIAARESTRAPNAEPTTAAVPTELPIDSIVPNPEQPRRHFEEKELDALADSIRRHGVLQPVLVRRASDGAPDRYELVVGERRWRASKRWQGSPRRASRTSWT